MKVFISSSYQDLKDVRERTIQGIRDLEGLVPLNMENFGARPGPPLEECLREVRRCDLFVLLIAEASGTILPELGVSFTEAEYTEATKRDIPVLVFLKTLNGQRESCLERHLKQFRTRVRNEQTPDYWETIDEIPVKVVTSIANHIRKHGEHARAHRAFLTADAYLAPFMHPEAPFNHVHSLAGRDEPLRSLMCFLADSGKRVAVMFGPGGEGKTRLLAEVARRATEADEFPEIRFLAQSVPITEDALRELPSMPVCIAIDDAHRMPDLEGAVATCLRHDDRSKVIISCRPWGRASAERILSMLSDSASAVLDLPPLDRKTEAQSLATNVLGAEHQELAGRLVAASDGNALIITVGGHYVRNGRIAPELLERVSEFRRAALDRLVDDLPATLGGGIETRRLMSVIAGIGPVQPSDPATLGAISSFLGVGNSDLVLALDGIRSTGCVQQKGHSLRVVPDVLSDHLLYDRAVNAAGQPTGFVDELVAGFGLTHLDNILRNASELEWRTRMDGNPADVLRETWESLLASLPERSHNARMELLEKLAGVAILAPKRTLQTVEWCLANPDAPRDDRQDLLDAFGISYSHASVLQNLPALLSDIALHLEFTKKCCCILWQLAKEDDRSQGPHLATALHTLQGLAEYRPSRPLSLQEFVVEAIGDVVEGGAHLGSRCSPTDVLEKALAREVEASTSDGFTFTFSRPGLLPGGTESLRSKAVDVLTKLGVGSDAFHALRALLALRALAARPTASLGRGLTDKELEAWKPERMRAAELMGQIGRESPFEVIRYQARRYLIEDSHHYDNEVGAAFSSSLDSVDPVDDEATYDALFCARRDRRLDDFRQEKVRHEREIRVHARKLLKQLPSPETLMRKLAGIATKIEATEPINEYTPHHFIWAIAEERDGDLRPLALSLMSHRASRLRLEISSLAMVARHRQCRDSHREIMWAILHSDDLELRRCVASMLRYNYGCREDGCDEADLAIVTAFAEDEDAQVRSGGLEALALFRSRFPRAALDVLVNADFGGLPKVADKALSAVYPKHGIEPDELTETDIDALLTKLQSVTQFPHGSHHLAQFIQLASKKRPASVVRMFMARIEFSSTLSGRAKERFQPIPHKGAGYSLVDLRSQSDYPDLLRTIRDKALANENGLATYWLSRLFHMACPDTTDAMKVVLEKGLSKDAKEVATAISLLEHHGCSLSERRLPGTGG